MLSQGGQQTLSSFTLTGLDLAFPALIPIALCTWVPRPLGQLAAASLRQHGSAPFSRQHGRSGSHQMVTVGVPLARPGEVSLE